jgi:hypothetical protein
LETHRDDGVRSTGLSKRNPRWILILFILLSAHLTLAEDPARRFAVKLKSPDVLPTGNEWIALPEIRASDGALESFNVLSMRDRGLLEVVGERGTPVLQPYFTVNGKLLALRDLKWELIEYWIPVAHFNVDGMEGTLTYCAPPGSRAAFIRLTIVNNRAEAVDTALGLKASWGALNRVTYTPVEQRGERTMSEAPWVATAHVFSFITHDTQFAWSVIYPGGQARLAQQPTSISPGLDAAKTVKLGPGESAEEYFVLGAGLEEFSGPHNAKALRELLDRHGAEEIIAQTAAWCRKRTRTTGKPDLDMLMNRNYLFTAMYAWGKTIDTEQVVGVTSRSPRYYVSAAYWDRDAMLWSFPGLLDIDKDLARDALQYALTIQLRNTGVHSRFIDGVVLEDGFELDEGVAPIVALAAYVKQTNDTAFLTSHKEAVIALRDLLLARFNSGTGMYSSLQDSQDEYQKQPFLTYDNALVWRALLDLSMLFDRLKDPAASKDMSQRADSLKKAVMRSAVSNGAPGATGTIFVSSTDGKNSTYADIPPGSLMKLPALGFVPEDDPVFTRTYEYLHSKNYRYSNSDQPYGLPGSYRLPFTTSWTVADHLMLSVGKEQALKILRASEWDGGIITEGVDPKTAVLDHEGRAFATAAGYVAHAICKSFCVAQ